MDEGSWQTAYHEAGHMVAAWDLGLNVLGATIAPDPEEGYMGRVLVPVEDRVRYADWVESEDAYLYAHAVMAYAGPEAGEKYLGAPPPQIDVDLGDFVSPDSDLGQIIGYVVAIAGSDEQDQSELSERAQTHAEMLIRHRWEGVVAVAEALMEHETLDGRECRELLDALE